MSTKNNRLNEIGKVNPFKTPPGYFEQFTSGLMSRLPERQTEEPPVIGLWGKMKPWVYMAAMFAGMALMVRIFIGIPVEKDHPSGLAITSPSEIEDFYSYYEDQVATEIYRESLFTDSSESDFTHNKE